MAASLDFAELSAHYRNERLAKPIHQIGMLKTALSAFATFFATIGPVEAAVSSQRFARASAALNAL